MTSATNSIHLVSLLRSSNKILRSKPSSVFWGFLPRSLKKNSAQIQRLRGSFARRFSNVRGSITTYFVSIDLPKPSFPEIQKIPCSVQSHLMKPVSFRSNSHSNVVLYAWSTWSNRSCVSGWWRLTRIPGIVDCDRIAETACTLILVFATQLTYRHCIILLDKSAGLSRATEKEAQAALRART